MDGYLLLRWIHIIAVIVSISLFVLRGGWMLVAPQLLDRRWVRIAPHIIDTVLLTSAIGLTVLIQQYPFTNGWLTAKLVALVLYIALGSIALKRGRSKRIRVAALVAALATVGYIVWVARAHQAWPFL